MAFRGDSMESRGGCRGGCHGTTRGMPRHPPGRAIKILCHSMECRGDATVCHGWYHGHATQISNRVLLLWHAVFLFFGGGGVRLVAAHRYLPSQFRRRRLQHFVYIVRKHIKSIKL